MSGIDTLKAEKQCTSVQIQSNVNKNDVLSGEEEKKFKVQSLAAGRAGYSPRGILRQKPEANAISRFSKPLAGSAGRSSRDIFPGRARMKPGWPRFNVIPDMVDIGYAT